MFSLAADWTKVARLRSSRRAAAVLSPFPARPAFRRRASARSRPARGHGMRRANAVLRGSAGLAAPGAVSIGASVSVSKPCMAMSPPSICCRRRDQDQVLDADAVGAFLVVARLVGQHHALEQLFGAGARDALRAFMHGQIGADAMAGAVGEVAAVLPQRHARDGIDLRAARARRENAAWKCRSCLSAPA